MKQALFIEAEYENDVMIIRPMGTFNAGNCRPLMPLLVLI